MERITEMLELTHTAERRFPPTDLYNEGWMLRLVLDWFSRNTDVDFDLQFFLDSRWYSEALLPSAFLARNRGDKLAESWTHADGVIGQFSIGGNGAGDLKLLSDSRQFLVTEAKMFSKLSTGVTNAKYYNQAARNVACIAEVVSRAGISPNSFEKIGFFLIAPESRIEEGVFSANMDRDEIRSTVQRRVSEYESHEKETWFSNSFLPILDVISLREISWEEIVQLISQNDSVAGKEYSEFYSKCLEYNQFVKQRYLP